MTSGWIVFQEISARTTSAWQHLLESVCGKMGHKNSRQETAPNIVYIDATCLQTVPDGKNSWPFGAPHIKKFFHCKSM